jgi:hypothetical protein
MTSNHRFNLQTAKRLFFSLSPFSRGEGRGEGHFPKLRLAVTPLTRPRYRFGRPLPARGERKESQASSARVVVRRRVRLSSCPSNPRERSADRRINHSTLARRGARLARHARLSALHRGDFGRRDCSNHHPDRPFGLLIPRASACVRPGVIYQLWRALVVGPGSTPRLPEMACETIRRRRTRSANQDAS